MTSTNTVAAASEDPDDDLIQGCADEAAHAWEELYTRFFPEAVWVAKGPRLGLSHEEAKDIAQDTMIDLSKAIRGGKLRKSLLGYVKVVAHHKSVDLIRKHDPLRKKAEQREDGSDPLDSIAATPAPLDSDKLRIVSLLSRMLSELQPPCVDLLRKRYYEEKKYRIIAAELDMPVNQIGVYLERCLTRFRGGLDSDTSGVLS
jgi:RNA polymerase sigma factor (sigma-70 family)